MQIDIWLESVNVEYKVSWCCRCLKRFRWRYIPLRFTNSASIFRLTIVSYINNDMLYSVPTFVLLDIGNDDECFKAAVRVGIAYRYVTCFCPTCISSAMTTNNWWTWHLRANELTEKDITNELYWLVQVSFSSACITSCTASSIA